MGGAGRPQGQNEFEASMGLSKTLSPKKKGGGGGKYSQV